MTDNNQIADLGSDVTTIHSVDDFILVYENGINERSCDELIEFYKCCEEKGMTISKWNSDGFKKHVIDTEKVSLNEDYITVHIDTFSISRLVTSAVWEVYNRYAGKYSILNDLQFHTIYDVRIEKTEVGGGYHVWKSETGDRNTSNRILTFIVYLNDVVEGGETEFLYFPKRIKAKKGTVCLFPGTFTHVHRGNPPISNIKYIASGWIQF